MNRTVVVAPGVGIVHGTQGADRMTLADRAADGVAFRGEQLARVPRRFLRGHHQRWMFERGMVQALLLTDPSAARDAMDDAITEYYTDSRGKGQPQPHS